MFKNLNEANQHCKEKLDQIPLHHCEKLIYHLNLKIWKEPHEFLCPLPLKENVLFYDFTWMFFVFFYLFRHIVCHSSLMA